MSNLKKPSSYGSKPVPSPRSQASTTNRVKSSTTSALIQRELLKNQKFGQDADDDDEEDYAPIRPKAPVRQSTAASNGHHSSNRQQNNVNNNSSSLPTPRARESKEKKTDDTDSNNNNSSQASFPNGLNQNNKISKSSAAESASSNKVSSKLLASGLNGLKKGSLAKERWAILRKAIVDKTSTFQESRASVRRFDAFGFVKCVKIAYTNTPLNNNYLADGPQRSSRYSNKRLDDDDDDDDVDVQYGKSMVSRRTKAGSVTTPRRSTETKGVDYQWFNVSVPSVDSNANVKVRFTNGNISLNDLAGFNNTGNVCLWPSEEIMTYFCVKNAGIFDDKCVCELGGGMTCLGGLMISKCSQPKEVFLTDGNESSFENLEVICNENEFECSVEVCLLQWSKETNYGDLEDRFDYIICADCLFFDEFREDLCVTIYKLLKDEGTCLIFAPNRQNTFHKFVDMAKLNFECMIVHDYDMEVWEKHLYEKEHNPDYEEDIHYPLLLKLKKRTQARGANDFCKMVL